MPIFIKYKNIKYKFKYFKIKKLWLFQDKTIKIHIKFYKINCLFIIKLQIGVTYSNNIQIFKKCFKYQKKIHLMLL